MKWTSALAVLNLGDPGGYLSHFVKLDLQSSESPQAKIVSPNDRLVRRECQICGAASDRFEYQLAFNARERCAETKMTRPTESQMTIVGPRNIEAIRIG